MLLVLAPAPAFAARRGASAKKAPAQPKRVVVESFRGPQSARVRSALISNLQDRPDQVELVSDAKFKKAVKKLGLRRLRKEDYPDLARHLGVAAFISGHTSRRGRKWAVQVEVRSGEDGEILGGETWSGKTLGALNSIEKNGYQRLEVYLTVTAVPGAEPKPNKEPQAENEPKAESQAAEEPASEAKPLPKVTEETLEERPPRTSEEPEPPPERPSRKVKDPKAGMPDGLSLTFLAGILNRSMKAQATVYNRGRSGGNPEDVLQEERAYESKLGHPEIGLQAEIYPGVLIKNGPVPNLGIVASYRHSLFLASSTCPQRANLALDCAIQDRVTVHTNESELYGGLRVRFFLGDDPKPLMIAADLGIGIFKFDFNLDDLRKIEIKSVLPPLNYTYAQLGAAVRYDVFSRYLSLGARFAYRLGLNNPDPNYVWGVSTSAANGFILSGEVRSEAPYLFEGAYFALLLDLFRFTTRFRGQAGCGVPGGQCTNNVPEYQNTEPWELFPVNNGQVVGGIPDPVADNYIRVALAFGWLLR